MEVETNNGATSSSTNQKIESSQTPVLIISERRRDTPRTRGKKKKAPPTEAADPGQPKISTKTFPTILSRILLKSNTPPVLPHYDYPYTNPFTQNLCFLCMEKPAQRKRLYHMFPSTDKTHQKNYDRVNAIYSNRADIKVVNQICVGAICARSLYRKVQKHFTDAIWNKQGNVFEVEKIGERDVWAVSDQVNKLHNEELEKLFNYIKYLSITKS
ncbi:uncharacterized protein LOC117889991 [Drosophila subobscura]|uniref:uncharacterized protein LOC117889991 n=1 Tax=Drosophila subobscura TaxID=7241 RepID=UPI00155AAB2F|nr:uncharacterized protein LOC117889991 [Drosophila subobscura]